MQIQFSCPKCDQKLTLTASKPGDWLDCPNCEAVVQVPGGPPPQPAGPPAAQRAPEPLDLPDDPPATTPAPEPLDLPDDPPARGLLSDKRVRLGAVAAGLGLLVVALLAVALGGPRDTPPEQVSNDPPAATQPEATQPAPPPVTPKENPPAPPEEPPAGKPVDASPQVAVAPPPHEVDAKPKPPAPPNFSNLDPFGNPLDPNTGLARQDEFKGQRLLFWCGDNYTSRTYLGPDNPLWKAFEEKGFVVQKEFGPFKREWLKSTDQLWLLSGRPDKRYEPLSADDYDAVEQFVKAGKGLCLLADNHPYYVEADELAKRLFGAQIRDNSPGTKTAYVRRPRLTPEDIRKYKGDYGVADHPLLAGVNFVYEGVTISNVSASDKLEVVVKASDGRSVLAVSKEPGRRVVIDCWYTRYCYGATDARRYITRTAGSVRMAQNLAAYLAGKNLAKEP